MRRRPDSVRVVAVVDLVYVHLEQFLLALHAWVALPEAKGQDRLFELPLHLPMRVGEQVRRKETHAHQLLADGRGARHLPPGRDVLQERADDAAEVDTGVGPEGLVLGRDLRVDHDLGNLGEGNHMTLLDGEIGELDTVSGKDPRPFVELEILHLADVGQAAGVAGVDRQDADEESCA